ncbi:cell division protein FtsX [Desulfobulbus alkaliphilus]|uniref:cell division protein FtsX n=1 Tax=Desulfobulbus alkaliphilus TaxID=869814 RepID=UPI001963717A|nr:permease-like cell division protein FtsX [Desulfobulbus alkaliphilus]MBM9536994.1 FtsX-like permease family protein [Desulfobulbus alkaliphilus]
MNFIVILLRQTGRNMFHTWKAQTMIIFTVALSVLIFSFFYLIYFNALHLGEKLGEDLRLIVYLEEEPVESLQEEYRRRILRFDQVMRIDFIDSRQAFERLERQLGQDSDILTGVPRNFLPPSIEVYPVPSLNHLSRIKRFSDYLLTLPGVVKVQYGKDWIDRFYAFIQLMRIVTLLSGILLIMTTTFMVAHTIRLTLLSRQQELKLLRLVGATNTYIRMPFLLEALLQGLLGAACGITALLVLFNWIKLQLAGPLPALAHLPFTFFPWPIILCIVLLSSLLCTVGSYSSTRKILQL